MNRLHLGTVAGVLVRGGTIVAAIGILGPIFVGWIQMFAIVALNLPEDVSQLAWVGRVVAGAVLFGMVTIPLGLTLAFLADRGSSDNEVRK